MRLTFSDSTAQLPKYHYRGLRISRYAGSWTIDGDDNIYYSLDHAYNAIDKRLGGRPRKGFTARHAKGIKIIGRK